MNGKRAKALRRAAREAADPTQAPMLVRRQRVRVKREGIVEPVTEFRDTHFAPKGSERQVYQEMKRGSS